MSEEWEMPRKISVFFFRLKKEVVDKLELGMVARSGQDSPFKEPFAQIVV